MMSPHTHVALAYARDEETARRAARRPDAVPDPDPEPQRAEVASTGRVRRSLARLHLTPARHA
jgi:hypothetical protein